MNRVVLFGLDGATYTVLDDLINRGVMPFLGRFMEEGTRAVLRSITPPLTPPAWSTIVTGRTPGYHGIFGFIQYDSPNANTPRIVTSRSLSSETIWSMVNLHGMRSGALNFVLHSPPPQIEGYVIPGWMPWRWLKRFTYPRGLIDRIGEQVAGFDIKQLAMDSDQERIAVSGAVLDDYAGWIRLHLDRDRQWYAVLRHQLQHDSAQLTGIVFDGVDKLQHLLWQYLDPQLAPDQPSREFERTRELCCAYFRQIDGFLEELVTSVAPDATILILSDHGFTGSRGILHINTWLERAGYLTWKEQTAMVTESCQELEPDFYSLSAFDMSRTKAYALTASSNGIHIVVEGERGSAGVAREEYEAFTRELTHRLTNECNDPESGEPLITQVWKREQIFRGPKMKLAPDLTLTIRDHSFFSVMRSSRIYTKRPVPMGTHHPDGVLIARGPGILKEVRSGPADLVDIAPTALYALRLPIPVSLEGRVLEEMFTTAYLDSYPPQWSDKPEITKAPVAAEEQGLEDSEIMCRLKALGYVE